ncbi:Thiol-disulfide oxidoreductase ResA [Anaerohalosphaera lusitana]|uniref:Thiol-disulfide oxidoreductase ResA n=1 Tax=Anaerohalosphaera lusitana TaxID=1936003 RepID=A0A1U9NKH8_9BACT|nr:redoxin domain-containing protein [Anaerohalosphaera lusitana]AQT68443.1 Thiol-disulfide oxidoreductase ResA [Anaerohalosphaera lusitana]
MNARVTVRMVILAVLSITLTACKQEAPPEASAKSAEPSGQAVNVNPGREMAEDFALLDEEGRKVRLSDLRGKIVVLEWTNYDCPFVQRHYEADTMEGLEAKYGDHVVWLAINSTHYSDTAGNKAWVEEQGLAYPVLDDHEGEVARAYGARTTPHMFVIDREGYVVYEGAIDNDPTGRGADEPVNYVDEALKRLVLRKDVEVSETKPYGCSVKLAQ